MKQELEQAAEESANEVYPPIEVTDYNARNRMLYIEGFRAGAEWQKKQKPVDLDKEIENKRRTMLLNLFGPMNGEQGLAIRNFARHFYELGLKARKEEEL